MPANQGSWPEDYLPSLVSLGYVTLKICTAAVYIPRALHDSGQQDSNKPRGELPSSFVQGGGPVSLAWSGTRNIEFLYPCVFHKNTEVILFSWHLYKLILTNKLVFCWDLSCSVLVHIFLIK